MKIKNVLFGKVLALLIVASPCIAEVVNEVDSNFDGKIDQWQHVDDKGKVLKIKYDGDFDGKVDQIEHFEGDKILEGIQERSVKDELLSNTTTSVKRGTFGSPTFYVGDEIFFGKDRLDAVEEELESQNAL